MSVVVAGGSPVNKTGSEKIQLKFSIGFYQHFCKFPLA
jgi:hypothetical protein